MIVISSTNQSSFVKYVLIWVVVESNNDDIFPILYFNYTNPPQPLSVSPFNELSKAEYMLHFV